LPDIESQILFSQFRELSEKDLIFFTWADSHPYQLFLSRNGLGHFIEERQEEDDQAFNSSYFYELANEFEIHLDEETSRQRKGFQMLINVDILPILAGGYFAWRRDG